jgi:hypothetical protein
VPVKRRRSSPLAEVMRYRNAEVIYRFTSTWDVTDAEAREVFDDLKRFLWLVTQPDARFVPPVPIIDEMWHAFLAYTLDYARFGKRYFGEVLHHLPTSRREKAAAARLFRKSPATSRARAERRMIKELTAVLAHLGEDVMLRWYAFYPERYGPRFFRTRRKPFDVPRVRLPAALRRRAAAARGRRAISAA